MLMSPRALDGIWALGI